MKALFKNKKFFAALVALGLSAALVIGMTAGSGGASTEAGPGDAQRISVGDPGPGASRFDILKPASASAVAALPDTVVAVLSNPPVQPEGTSTPQEVARGTVTALGAVPKGSGSSEVDVAEVNGMFCLFAVGEEYKGAAVGDCPSIAAAEAGEAYVVVPAISPGLVRVVGLVPNDVVSIAIDSGDDGTIDQKVAVTSNVYQADVEDVPTAVSGLTRSGDTAFHVKFPLAGLAS